jgi:hypothetical protein
VNFFPEEKIIYWEVWQRCEPLDDLFGKDLDGDSRRILAAAISKIFESSFEGRAIISFRMTSFLAWWDEVKLRSDYYLSGLRAAQFVREKGEPQLLMPFLDFLEKKPGIEVVRTSGKVLSKRTPLWSVVNAILRESSVPLSCEDILKILEDAGRHGKLDFNSLNKKIMHWISCGRIDAGRIKTASVLVVSKADQISSPKKPHEEILKITRLTKVIDSLPPKRRQEIPDMERLEIWVEQLPVIAHRNAQMTWRIVTGKCPALSICSYKAWESAFIVASARSVIHGISYKAKKREISATDANNLCRRIISSIGVVIPNAKVYLSDCDLGISELTKGLNEDMDAKQYRSQYYACYGIWISDKLTNHQIPQEMRSLVSKIGQIAACPFIAWWET